MFTCVLAMISTPKSWSRFFFKFRNIVRVSFVFELAVDTKSMWSFVIFMDLHVKKANGCLFRIHAKYTSRKRVQTSEFNMRRLEKNSVMIKESWIENASEMFCSTANLEVAEDNRRCTIVLLLWCVLVWN